MNALYEIFSNGVFFGLTITVGAFLFGVLLKKRFKNPLFNPILIGVAIVATTLKIFHIDYARYATGAKFLSDLLTPATICLAIPLYRQFELLKKNWASVLASISVGTATNLTFVYFVAKLWGLNHEMFATFLTKSITTAIGIGVAEENGGDSSLAVVMIILTGINGNVWGDKLLKLFGIVDPLARGLAIGTASHAIGTARALELGETEGASSGLAVVVTGLLTVILAPFFARLIC